VGKSLVPVMLKFKAQEDMIDEGNINSLKKGHSFTRLKKMLQAYNYLNRLKGLCQRFLRHAFVLT
jgi:hypothetical protein